MVTHTKPDRPTFASLFCGCGGFDLGFTQAGFRCAAAFDVDPVAVRIHNQNLQSRALVSDLSIVGPLPISLRGVDVLVAGPPCQGFSTIGRRDPKDPRNSLMLRTGDIAVANRPKVLVVENVVGVMAGVQRKFWESLKQRLRDAGYRLTDFRVDVRDFGVAQTRRRMILLAWRSNTELSVESPKALPLTLRNALEGVAGTVNHNPRPLPATSLSGKIASSIRRGQKLCNVRTGPSCVPSWDLPAVFGRVTRCEASLLKTIRRLRRRNRLRDFGDADPVSARVLSISLGRPVSDLLSSLVAKGYVRRIDSRYDLTHTFNGKYRRLEWDRPAPTVDTRFGDPRYFLHPDMDRGFTVREAARIQGFPDSFVFDGDLRSQYRFVGNAVPPPLGRFLGCLIRNQLLEGG